MTSQSTQAQAFLQRQPTPVVENVDPTKPRVVFETVLSQNITRQQEEKMLAFYKKRKQELSRDLGREQVKQKSWWSYAVWSTDSNTNTVTWLGKRMLMELVYNQNLDFRPYVNGGIYSLSQNVHLPRCRQITQQMVARANNYFFGTEPYFSVNPMLSQGVNSTPADQTNDYAQFKFEKAHVKSALEKAVEKAFIRGESVIKTRHWTNNDRYQTKAMVAVAGAKGAALMANDNDFIYGPTNTPNFNSTGDKWMLWPQMTADQKQQIDEDATTAGVAPDYFNDPVTGQPRGFPEAMVLERDKSTCMPGPEFLQNGQLIFEPRVVWRTKTIYSGPEAVNVYPDDFLAPLNAPSLQEADCLIHIYPIQALEIWNMLQERMKANGDADPDLDQLARALKIMRTAPSNRTDAVAATMPRTDLRENGAQHDPGEPMITVNETYLTFDANQDGFAEKIFMLVDEEDNPIIYDYLSNVFPDSKRPFHAVVINPVEGRWHGIGMMEIFWELQKFIDLMLNRWEFSESRAGKVIFWHPELTLEGENNPALQLNTGSTYRKKNPETRAEQILEQVDLHEFKGENLKELLETANQMLVSLSATPSINDAALAGLDSTKLATGIKAIQRTAAEGFAPFLSSLEVGLQSALESLLSLLLFFGNEVEIYHVLEGDGYKPLEINTINARNIDYAVNMELTRYHNAQQISEAASARACALNFMGLPYLAQLRLAPLFIEEMKGYMVPNPTAYIKPDPQLSGMQLPGAPGSTPALPGPASSPPPPNPLDAPS